MEEALNEIYQVGQNTNEEIPEEDPFADFDFEDFEEEFDFEDFESFIDPSLDHTEVGSLWYGINNKYADKIFSTDETEWLITLSLDIAQFYEYGGYTGVWMHTGDSQCLLEVDDMNEALATVWFIVTDPYGTCDPSLVGVTMALTEDEN